MYVDGASFRRVGEFFRIWWGEFVIFDLLRGPSGGDILSVDLLFYRRLLGNGCPI